MITDGFKMDGRVAMVIGCGGGGMGTATSMLLSELGAAVVAVDVSREEVEQTETAIRKGGGTCLGFTADATDSSAIEAIVEQAWKELGPIQHLANVVGGSRSSDWLRSEEYPEETFNRVVQFNLATPFIASGFVVRRLVESDLKGSIVNYSSVAGVSVLPYQPAYAAAKAGLNNLTRTLAVEWGPHQIRINAVAPGGGIETPRVQYLNRSVDSSMYAPEKWNPLQRGVKPEEVAAVAVFLLSDLAAAVTGQTVTVDAGVTSRAPSGGLDRWAVNLQGGSGRIESDA